MFDSGDALFHRTAVEPRLGPPALTAGGMTFISEDRFVFDKHNAELKGAPTDHIINVREVRLSAGAEFVVVICGEVMTMPGLPKVPAAYNIDVGADGKIVGLF